MTDLYRKVEGRCMAELGPLPTGAEVWMVDEMVTAYVPVVFDYEAGCKEMESRSMGWQTCGDDGDLESFTHGVKTALGIDDE